MTHLSSTTSTVTNAGRGSTLPQVQQPVQVDGARDRAPQEPLYPPGLGFSPPLRPISRARDRGVLGDAVVEYRTGSSLLDGPLVGLGLCGVAVEWALDEAQNTRIRPAVCLGLPWPPVVGVEHVAHWPPEVALHEERMAGPGLQLSMLEDLDLEAKQLMPLNLQRACVGLWCSLCAHKSLYAQGTSCEVEPINPEEYMDFSFLDEDDDPQAPSRPSAPNVEEEGSDSDSLEESDTASALTNDDSAPSGSPPSPAASRRSVCLMRGSSARGGMTLESLWREGHIRDDETAAAPIRLAITALEEASPDPEPLWQPSTLSPVEEEREKEGEM